MGEKSLQNLFYSAVFLLEHALWQCVLQTNLLLHLPLNTFSFYCFVFGATLVQYNLHYLVKKSAVKNSQRLAWSLRNKSVHKVLLGAGIGFNSFQFSKFPAASFYYSGVSRGHCFFILFPCNSIRKEETYKGLWFS